MNAIVIGAGVNELVCAHLLARAGRRVLVLEGRAAHHDILFDQGWIPPKIIRDLELRPRGLKVDCPDPWVAVPLPDGGTLELWQDMARSVEAIRRLSPRDADRWPAFCKRIARLAKLLERLYLKPPPDPLGSHAADLAQLAATGLRMRLLGRQGIEDFLRVATMPVADLLDDWFESDALKGVLGAAGIFHTRQGPRSGGTAFNFLHGHVGNPAGLFRPPVSNARRVLAELPGIEVRNAADLSRIIVRAGRVAGVALAGGEEMPATHVVSGADPRRTLLELADPGWLDTDVVRAVKRIRCRGVTARVSLALERPPAFSTLVVAPSLDYLERASDDAKYGRVSQAPYLEARDDGRAADGRHRIIVHAQYAPYALAQGEWNGERRRALGELAVKLLSQHAPEFRAAAVESVLSPRELESEYGFPEGQAHHAELALDQALWMRPVPQCARYRTPIAGLYLCGPATHPGGGVAGAAGANAARVILRDLRRGAAT